MNPIIKLTDVDKFWLALNAYHEARGESADGIRAVIHVALNRAAKRKQSVFQVVTAPKQFSWTIGDAWPIIKDNNALGRIYALFPQVEAERDKAAATGTLPVSGADHYYAPKGMPGGKPPSWAATMKFVQQIGGHRFYVA